MEKPSIRNEDGEHIIRIEGCYQREIARGIITALIFIGDHTDLESKHTPRCGEAARILYYSLEQELVWDREYIDPSEMPTMVRVKRCYAKPFEELTEDDLHGASFIEKLPEQVRRVLSLRWNRQVRDTDRITIIKFELLNPCYR